MSPETNNPEQLNPNPSGSEIEWRRTSRQDIEAMSEQELRQYLYIQDIKTQRLYSVLISMAEASKSGQDIRGQDIEHILRPERINK